MEALLNVKSDQSMNTTLSRCDLCLLEQHSSIRVHCTFLTLFPNQTESEQYNEPEPFLVIVVGAVLVATALYYFCFHFSIPVSKYNRCILKVGLPQHPKD